METAKEALETQLNTLLHSEAWTQTLKSMAVLGRTSIARLSFRNLMLLVSQRPEIHHAATFQAWRALGRSVRKGEKALHVLKPRFAKRAAATQSGDEADSWCCWGCPVEPPARRASSRCLGFSSPATRGLGMLRGPRSSFRAAFTPHLVARRREDRAPQLGLHAAPGHHHGWSSVTPPFVATSSKCSTSSVFSSTTC